MTATMRSAPAVSAAAQLGIDVAGVGDEVAAVVDDADPQALALEAGRLLVGRGAVGHQHDGRRRRVVRRQHAGRSRRPVGGGQPDVEQPLDVLGRDATGPEQLRGIGRAVDDRALDADRAGPAVEDHVARRVEERAEVLDDVTRRRRAHPAEAVGRRGGDGESGHPQQRLGEGMGRRPQADGVAAAGDGVGHAGRPGEQQRQRPRPARGGQHGRGRWHGRRPVGQPRREHVDDERVVGGAALHREDAGDGGGGGRVGGEAVDGLGRDGHEAAAPQPVGGEREVGRDERIRQGWPRGTPARRR